MQHLDAIRDFIKSRGTQEQAAAELDVTPALLSNILSGKQAITLNVAWRMEEAFGLDAAVVLREQLEIQWNSYKAKMEAAKNAG